MPFAVVRIAMKRNSQRSAGDDVLKEPYGNGSCSTLQLLLPFGSRLLLRDTFTWFICSKVQSNFYYHGEYCGFLPRVQRGALVTLSYLPNDSLWCQCSHDPGLCFLDHPVY